MKRFLVTVLAGMMIFVASGCGGGSDSKPAGGDAKPDTTNAPAAGEKAAEPAAK